MVFLKNWPFFHPELIKMNELKYSNVFSVKGFLPLPFALTQNLTKFLLVVCIQKKNKLVVVEFCMIIGR